MWRERGAKGRLHLRAAHIPIVAQGGVVARQGSLWVVSNNPCAYKRPPALAQAVAATGCPRAIKDKLLVNRWKRTWRSVLPAGKDSQEAFYQPSAIHE